MPLPFNNKHNNIRHYGCFVCGVLFSNFTDFKDHVKKSHEEGREYITCPLERCGAPVRDMRAHYKACHPHYECPKNVQMRVAVWKDPKDPNRKRRKLAFEEGYFSSAKNRKNLHYRSSWERKVYEILEKRLDVVAYEVEPFAVEYYFEGERQNYLPDLRVYFDNGSKEIWEIKPTNQTLLGINQAKWEACAAFCEKRGWAFKVITETGLAKMKHDLRKSIINKETIDE